MYSRNKKQVNQMTISTTQANQIKDAFVNSVIMPQVNKGINLTAEQEETLLAMYADCHMNRTVADAKICYFNKLATVNRTQAEEKAAAKARKSPIVTWGLTAVIAFFGIAYLTGMSQPVQYEEAPVSQIN